MRSWTKRARNAAAVGASAILLLSLASVGAPAASAHEADQGTAMGADHEMGVGLTFDSAHPLTPDWNLDDAVQQMRDDYMGGTVPKEQMTGQVREFQMHVDEIEQEIAPGVKVKAWAFGLDGQPATLPGPTLRVKKGDLVKITLKNNTTNPHSIHSHGITSLDELNDGVPHVSGNYIMPGQSFTYEYVASEAGTHWYHCHVQTSLHQDMGMYGALIVEDTAPPTWDKEFTQIIDEWDTQRDPNNAAQRPNYNYFLVNGKAGALVPDMVVKDGEIARIRLINAGFETHSLHLHGTHFVITHKDGYLLPRPQSADTLAIHPGETYDLLVKGRDGVWPWHDHNSLAVTDNGVYPGGMIMHIRGSEAIRFDPSQQPTHLPLEGEIHGEMGGMGDEGHSTTGGIELGAMHAPVVTDHAVTPDQTPGQAVAFNPIAPPQPEQGKVVDVHLEAKRVMMQVAPGDTREVWTFNGQVPAPTIRIHQGDTLRVTLTNKDPEMAHGLDFHAGQMDSGTFHKPIEPGQSETFEFKANYPGVFYFHCSAGPVIMHIANGMFGAVIVDPPGYKPEGKEFVLIQNEWYNPAGGLQAMMTELPTAVALNGVAAQYVDKPLQAVAGEKTRFYFVNAGINDFTAFHVIGTIFDQVLLDGNPKNLKKGVQTVTIPPGGALVTDLRADSGTYPILTHQMNDATKGALGILQVNAGPVAPVAEQIAVVLNGKAFTGSYRIEADHVVLPVKEFAEFAGVAYTYDEATMKLTFAGQSVAVMDMGHGGALYVPVRALAEALGASVAWDGVTRTVTLTK
ncbi:MAG TPA: multicopper oxidase domain-containing protein [Symbiobacteriaceae bacterium]|nr:multicopper oxidase domain-containing protein [Symbiobacteriaceae bacterium]